MRSFVKIIASQNGKSLCPLLMKVNHALVTIFYHDKLCLLMLFAKIKFSQNFRNVQYM